MNTPINPVSNTIAREQSRVSQALDAAGRQLMAHQNAQGFWEGQLSSSALSTATAISALSFYQRLKQPVAKSTTQSTSLASQSGERSSDIENQIESGLAWLVQQQNGDGGFGDTDKSYSNISTTMLVVAAIEAANRTSEFESLILQAQTYIDGKGGIPGLRARYGRDKTFAVPILANCAMAGIVPWKEVSALPFEASVVPQRFYNLMQLPVVSYAIPALVAIGQAKFVNDPPWNPVAKLARRMSVGRSLKVLDRMQPASGGFLEAVPLTSFVAMGLINANQGDHPVVDNCVRFILDSFRQEDSDHEPAGSWPIDTNLSTWNTTLTINSLANCPALFSRFKSSPANGGFDFQATLDWLLSCQNTEVHPFTGAAPGGWGWSDLSGAVPDADDTPGAMIALRHLYDLLDQEEFAEFSNQENRTRILAAAELGAKWLVNLQNRDKGWPTFCRGWGKLPFDRSGSDITAHAIRGLLAWQNQPQNQLQNQLQNGPQSQTLDSKLNSQISRAVERGFQFIRKGQNPDGSWLPLWFGNQDLPDDTNPCYGTAKVLMAYKAADSFDSPVAESGLRWLIDNQHSDGGWGGGTSMVRDAEHRSTLGTSSVEETALATETCLAVCQWAMQNSKNQTELMQRVSIAANRGLDWLIEAVRLKQINQTSPIGFYFAKLWYHEKLYPLIFATGALAAANQQPDHDQQFDDDPVG